MSSIENFYIADGHHRSASTAEFSDKVKGLANDKSMCYIVEEDQLDILPFHRLIKPAVQIEKEDLIGQLSKDFFIDKSSDSLYKVNNTKEFGLYMEGEWLRLRYKEESDLLDVEILEELVIRKVFGIADSRTDSQITFHPFSSGSEEMINLVDSKTFSVAITTKPCTFSDVRRVSDRNSTLPPKSTYIEPKLRAGLIIQEFEVINNE